MLTNPWWRSGRLVVGACLLVLAGSWALNNLDITARVAPVLLPASLPLLGLGLAGLGLISRRKARKSV